MRWGGKGPVGELDRPRKPPSSSSVQRWYSLEGSRASRRRKRCRNLVCKESSLVSLLSIVAGDSAIDLLVNPRHELGILELIQRQIHVLALRLGDCLLLRRRRGFRAE